jgi:hypothetical protein
VGQVPDSPDLPSSEAKDQFDELMRLSRGNRALGGPNVTVTQTLAAS